MIPPEKPKPPTPTAFIIPPNAYSRTITATITQRKQTGQLRAVSFVDAAHGWLAADNVLLATGDGGVQWQRRYTAPYPIFSLDFVSLMHGWMQINNVKANRLELYATTDGGSSWQQITIAGMAGLSSVQFVDEQHGWLYASITGPSPNAFNTADTRLKRTQDGGKTWSDATIPCSGNWWAGPRYFVNAGTGWLMCLSGAQTHDYAKQLYKTTDGGEHWQLISESTGTTPPDPNKLSSFAYAGSLYFLDEMHGWFNSFQVMCQCGNMYISTSDGGKTWTNYVLDDLKPAAVQFTDPMHGWLYDLNGQRYVTADGGHSWQQVE